MEAVDLLRKFLLTGVLQNVLPESRVQIWFGCVVCFISFVLYHEASPYENAWCGYLQEMVLLQLLFSYISAFLFFNDGGDHYGADAYKWGFTLVIVNNLCAEHDLDRSASGSARAAQGAARQRPARSKDRDALTHARSPPWAR